MERKWLEKFYTECGREVSLAYNVLNHSDNWGVTLTTAILATGFVRAVEIKSGQLTLHYPTIVHWFFIIIAWIIMLRFFVRSALGLVNMYRWNTLIVASSKVLSLAEGNAALPVYVRNCAKQIDAYYYAWRSPIPKKKLIWRNLKLMYLWFFLIVLTLFTWGVVFLDKNWVYWVGIAIFGASTAIETYWFMNYYGLKYEKLDLEEEPRITQLWQGGENAMGPDKSSVLILGFCEDGPYKRALSLLNNPDVSWLPWSYAAGRLDSTLINDLSGGYSLKDQRVAFVCWHSKFQGETPVLRYGRIDYFSFIGGILQLTVTLENYDEATKVSKVSVHDSKILCFYQPS